MENMDRLSGKAVTGQDYENLTIVESFHINASIQCLIPMVFVKKLRQVIFLNHMRGNL